ncbi:MAG: hypothetical protein JSR97_11485 [Verrucomicrobia bacterium]|nr:hypothetical protein [Verrucomicrobiota bacterium]
MKKGIILLLVGLLLVLIVAIPKILHTDTPFFIPGVIIGTILEIFGIILIVKAVNAKKV